MAPIAQAEGVIECRKKWSDRSEPSNRSDQSKRKEARDSQQGAVVQWENTGFASRGSRVQIPSAPPEEKREARSQKLEVRSQKRPLFHVG